MDALVVRSGATHFRLEVEERTIEVRASVRDKFGRARIEDFDVLLTFHLRQEQALAPFHEFGDPVTSEQMAPVSRWVDTPHQPFLITDDYTRARGELEHTP